VAAKRGFVASGNRDFGVAADRVRLEADAAGGGVGVSGVHGIDCGLLM